MLNKNFDIELIKNIITDQKLRQQLAYESHYWFFNIYFSGHVKYETANFQKEMFQITQDENNPLVVIVSFRGSGKTTIIANSFPIWSIIGKLQKKYIVILCKTQENARRTLKNIKDELENNDLLRDDLGPFQEEHSTDWNAASIFIPKFGARITVASMEQSIRGTKHGSYRPDLIILDDVEDLDSVRTRESRDKLYQWFTGDVVPLGDKDTQIFIIGNLLHEDSLLKRLKNAIENERMDGVYKEYPLVNEKEEILWPGKYPNIACIEIEKRRLGNNIAWHREFLLKILPSEEQIIYPEWIQYYYKLPDPTDKTYKLYYTLTGIDLAISEKDSADYTAMVTAKIYQYPKEKQWLIYILPNPINDRLKFLEILNTAENIVRQNMGRQSARTVIETVGFQAAAAQELRNRRILVKDFIPHGDKHSRLMSISHMIQMGNVRFPNKGCETLIQQLTGFGVERYDDLMDALVMVILEVIRTPIRSSFYPLEATPTTVEAKKFYQFRPKNLPAFRSGQLKEDGQRENYGNGMGDLMKIKF